LAMPTTPDKWQVLFDLNILLDVLMKREPFLTDASRLWALAETHQVDGFVAGHSFTTLFYLYRRQGSTEVAYQVMRKLLQVFCVVSIDHEVLAAACDLAWRDFEDAVQAVAARQSKCQYLVTRNPDDYRDRNLTVILPADFLAIWASQEAGRMG
jgi:predicted nucleic acid-binding protein